MTYDELKKLALANRHRLIFFYLAFCRESDSSCAYELTQHAIRCGYVKPRKSLPGATLRTWANEGGATHWACRAALDLIMKSGYQPRTNGEWAAVVYLWLEKIEPHQTKEQIIQSFPAHLDRKTLAKMLPGS